MPRFVSLADADRFGIHSLADRAEHADIILFVDARPEHGEWHFRTMRRHQLVRYYREKCFVYDESDQPWCSLPGLYVSMPADSFNRWRQRACGYASLVNADVCPAAAEVDRNGGPRLLFSFLGRDCHPTRRAVLSIRHARASVEDTSAYSFFGDANCPPVQLEDARRRYASIVADSKFVLCPRGSGTSSFRLFETLAAGRVPVIISDDWLPIPGPDWRACAVRVPERNANAIPDMLESLESQWSVMAAAARHVWVDYFARDVIWHRMIESIVDIQQTRGGFPAQMRRYMPDRRYARLYLRHAKHRVMQTLGRRR